MPIVKRFIFTMFTGIMFIGMLTFSTGHPIKNPVVIKNVPNPTLNDPEDVTPVPTEEAVPTPVDDTSSKTDVENDTSAKPTLDPDAPNPLRLEIYPDVHEIIEQYFDAKAAGDIATLKTLVTDPVYISAETITAQTEYVKGYSDLKCYTKQGGGIIDLVVYCTFYTTITTVDTPIPSLESFYIIYKDGKPVIFSGIFDEETQAILTKLDNDEDLKELQASIYTEIDNAVASDPTVKDFWDKLTNAVDPATEDSESSESGTPSE